MSDLDAGCVAMKVGDLVRVNRRAYGTWGRIGVVIGRKRRYESGRSPLVIVMMNGTRKLIDYCDIEVINESP